MRAVLISLFLGLLALYPQNALAPQAFSVENEFVRTWTEWKPLRESAATHPGTIDASELRAWKRVQEQWKILNRYMESQH